MKRRPGSPPNPAGRPEVRDPEELDRWIDALLDGVSSRAGGLAAQAGAGAEADVEAGTGAEADVESGAGAGTAASTAAVPASELESAADAEARAGRELDSLAHTVRALSDLPALDPIRQAAMLAALEARFAITAGSRPSAGDPASAEEQPRPSRLDALASRFGVSAASLRLLALLFAIFILAGLFYQASRPESAPADGGQRAPAVHDEPGAFDAAAGKSGPASEAEQEVEAAGSGDAAKRPADAASQSADVANRELQSMPQATSAAATAAQALRQSDATAPRSASTATVRGAASTIVGLTPPGKTPPGQTQSAADGTSTAASALSTARPRSVSDPGQSSTERYALTGYVRDAEGRGIADAIVTAWQLADAGFFVQRSEADGSYRLELSAGQYRLHADATGYAERWYDGPVGSSQREGARKMSVPAADNNSVDFVLPRVGGR